MNLYPKWNYRQTENRSVHLSAWTYARHEITNRWSFCSPVCIKLQTEDHSLHLYLKWNYRQADAHSVHLCAWTYTQNETIDKQRITCVRKLVSEIKLQRIILSTCVHELVSEMKLQTNRRSFCWPVCINVYQKWFTFFVPRLV